MLGGERGALVLPFLPFVPHVPLVLVSGLALPVDHVGRLWLEGAA